MQQAQPQAQQPLQPGQPQGMHPQQAMQQQAVPNGYPPQPGGGYPTAISAPMQRPSSAQQAHPAWDAQQQQQQAMLQQQHQHAAAQQQQQPQQQLNGYPPANGGMAPAGGEMPPGLGPQARMTPVPGQPHQQPGIGMQPGMAHQQAGTPKLEPGASPGPGGPVMMQNGQPGQPPQVMGMTMGHNGGMPVNGMMSGPAASSAVMSNGVPVLRSRAAGPPGVAAGPGGWQMSQAPPMVQNVGRPPWQSGAMAGIPCDSA